MNFRAPILLLGLLYTGPVLAQDTIVPALPPVPTAGVSPLLNWALSLLTAVITILLPIVVVFLKQRLNVASTTDRNTMIDRAIKRGGLISYGNQMAGATAAEGNAAGVTYVKNAVPQAIGTVDQATDTHLANAVAAEVVGLAQTGAPPVPSVIVKGN